MQLIGGSPLFSWFWQRWAYQGSLEFRPTNARTGRANGPGWQGWEHQGSLEFHPTNTRCKLASGVISSGVLRAEIDGLGQVIEGTGQLPHLCQDDGLGVEGPDVLLA